MTNRLIIYSNSVGSSQSFNAVQQNAMMADGNLPQALFGTSTTIGGFGVTPTSPGSLAVNIAPGVIFQWNQVDPSGVAGSLVNANYCMKSAATNAIVVETGFTAPASGQSTNYLLEANFLESQGNPQYLNYATQAANGVVTRYTGSTQVNTTITDTVSFQLKAGAPANTGTQTTPGTDAGWVALAVITVNGGSTAITAANITIPTNIPSVAAALSSLLGTTNFLTAAQAGALYVLQSQLSTGSTAGTVAQRDGSGGLTAIAFHGVADSALNANNASYAASAGSASTAAHASISDTANSCNSANSLQGYTPNVNSTANSIPLRDGSGNLTAGAFHGLADSATTATNLNGYVQDVNGSASSIALRDGSGNLTANNFNGTAISADFADFAERFEASEPMEPGDLVQFGGEKEICLATAEKGAFAVISTAPAYLANQGAGNDHSHPPVALHGRVPTKVSGPCGKGDWLVASNIPGVAVASKHHSILAVGRALADKQSPDIGLVLAFVHARV